MCKCSECEEKECRFRYIPMYVPVIPYNPNGTGTYTNPIITPTVICSMESKWEESQLEIINCNRIADFNGATRKYYDIHDMRVLDVTVHHGEEKFHKHNKVTEILFTLNGEIRVFTKDEDIKLVSSNQVIVFPPGEYHRIEPVGEKVRILAIKYIRTENNQIELLSSDWEGA